MREPLLDEAPIVAAHDLGVLFVHLGRFAAARAVLDRAMERAAHVHARSQSDRSTHDVARLHHALAECSLDDDDPIAARPHVDRALKMRAELDGREHPLFGATLATAARLQHLAKDHDLAQLMFTRAIELTKTPAGHTFISAQISVLLAALYVDLGRIEEAKHRIDLALPIVRCAGEDHAFLCRGLRVRARIERLRNEHEQPTTTEATIARIVTSWWGG
jgi:tetratricopeptide (TPR) repeat protein